MTEFKILGFVAVVMLIDELVVVFESLEANGILLHVLIDFVIACCIVSELELVSTDGGGGRSEGSESDRSHV